MRTAYVTTSRLDSKDVFVCCLLAGAAAMACALAFSAYHLSVALRISSLRTLLYKRLFCSNAGFVDLINASAVLRLLGCCWRFFSL
jgi:hypothetical protein